MPLGLRAYFSRALFGLSFMKAPCSAAAQSRAAYSSVKTISEINSIQSNSRA